jgi:hypothetical protein
MINEIKSVLSLLNCLGYFLWGVSILSFLDDVLNATFDFKNINSFLSMITAILALVFAFFKLIAYIRDSNIKSKILEQELFEKENNNFRKKWNKEFEA